MYAYRTGLLSDATNSRSTRGSFPAAINPTSDSAAKYISCKDSGQFIAHIAALPGNPYDGHTLATVIPAMEKMIGNTIERALGGRLESIERTVAWSMGTVRVEVAAVPNWSVVT